MTDYSGIKNKVISVMQGANINDDKVEELNNFIDKDIDNKIKIAQELEKEIAMYQGQATLGKIMDVVMHEVRKPLAWMRNQTQNLKKVYNRYLTSGNIKDLDKIVRIIEETPNQLGIISDLFKSLNSLATRKRSAMVVFNLNDLIKTAIEIFNEYVEKNNIFVKYEPAEIITFLGWREDILSAIANILENAVYWVNYNKNLKQINITLNRTEDSIEIGIWNSGPSIIKDLIQDNSLFVPGISGKITEEGNGTGLGLAIAGEAIDRNGGVIKVVDVQEGAKFIIELPNNTREG